MVVLLDLKLETKLCSTFASLSDLTSFSSIRFCNPSGNFIYTNFLLVEHLFLA
jgi:hypothetical protein